MTEKDLRLIEKLKTLLDERGIAWNGGPGALRSLTDAVPFLVADVRRLRRTLNKERRQRAKRQPK